MTRNDLKDIISSVIEKLQGNSPAAACGWLYADDPVITTYYAVGEEGSTPIPTIEPKPTPTPTATTKYAIGEEDVVTTRYSVGEEA
jgi:hypothetical protein